MKVKDHQDDSSMNRFPYKGLHENMFCTTCW